MTDYATLQADVASFSARSDLAAQIPGFIRLAEARIAREIRVFEMQVADTLTVPDTGSLALPTGFLGFRHVAAVAGIGLNGTSAEMDYLAPDVFHELRENAGVVTGTISDNYYTLEAGNILISPIPGTGLTQDLNVAYWQRFTELSDVNTTNWLLTNHFDVYLAAVMKELNGFIMDDVQEDRWNEKFAGKVETLHRSERRKQRSGPHIRRPRFAP